MNDIKINLALTVTIMYAVWNIINRFDNNNRKLNNVMYITESINIDSYQAN